jgi:hypothetical protein
LTHEPRLRDVGLPVERARRAGCRKALFEQRMRRPEVASGADDPCHEPEPHRLVGSASNTKIQSERFNGKPFRLIELVPSEATVGAALVFEVRQCEKQRRVFRVAPARRLDVVRDLEKLGSDLADRLEQRVARACRRRSPTDQVLGSSTR